LADYRDDFGFESLLDITDLQSDWNVCFDSISFKIESIDQLAGSLPYSLSCGTWEKLHSRQAIAFISMSISG